MAEFRAKRMRRFVITRIGIATGVVILASLQRPKSAGEKQNDATDNAGKPLHRK